jgi:hypothetical protein
VSRSGGAGEVLGQSMGGAEGFEIPLGAFIYTCAWYV